MEHYKLFLWIGLSAIAIGVIIYFHVRKWSKKIRINLNEEGGIEKLTELFLVFDQKNAYLILELTETLVEEFKNYSTLTIPLVFRTPDLVGGLKLVFEIRQDYNLFDKIFCEPGMIKGYFKIVHLPGPELGWYKISLIPI